ncbi:MAG: rhombosortase [Woeseia sp.]
MGLDQDDASRVPRLPVLARAWWLPFTIGALSLAAELGGETVRTALRYSRPDIGAGELWRLASGHLVHLGWSHFAMNVTALLLIWLLVGRSFRPSQWLLITAVVMAGIDAGFWFIDTQLLWYVGLSGVLHGLLVAGLVGAWSQSRIEVPLLLLLLAAKLAYEQLFGAMPGSESSAGGAVVVNAHLYGALAGGVAALLAIRYNGRHHAQL